MSGGKLCLLGLGGLAVQSVVLGRISWWGVSPMLFPGLVYLTGRTWGETWGAACGLFCGILWYLAGGNPWQMVLLAVLGGISGVVFPRVGGFWGKWLCFLPLLGAWEVCLMAGHWLSGSGPWGPAVIAGREWLLSGLSYPLAWGLVFLAGRTWHRPARRRRRKKRKSL